jgi:multicomponent Na+:H+ antiporter subunit D
MLAYSAIGQVGYVLVAIGIGGPVGFAAAILYTVVNALNKTLLFLTARMRGAIVGAAFMLGALSVAGVPPAAGFVGKLELFRTASDSPVLLALLFLGGALSFLYVFQVCQYDFWRGERSGPASAWTQQAVVAALGLLVLAAGIWPEPLLALSQDAAQALAGGGG